jgi:hypothetical protein
MRAPLVNVDFVGRRPAVTLTGGLLLLLGVGAAVGAGIEYQRLEARRAGLELKLEAVSRRGEHQAAQDSESAALNEEAARVAQQLGTPWTKLLAELEAASHDSAGQIALLSVEPDQAKHNVHITGESRDLPVALAYVQRLQGSSLLRYPMLDSHDVRTDDPQHPVRFAMTAEWRELTP